MRLIVIFSLVLFFSFGAFAQKDTSKISLDYRSFDQESLEVYKSDRDYQYIEAQYEENSFQKLWRRFRNALIRILGEGLGSKIFQYLLIAVALAAIAWFLLKSSSDSFISRKNTSSSRYVEELDIREDFQVLYDKYEQAKKNEDFKEAIRISYILLLKKLNDQDQIQWKEWKLSSQYADEIKNHEWRIPFKKMTEYFNFSWYGKREISMRMFELVEEKYKDLATKLEKGA